MHVGTSLLGSIISILKQKHKFVCLVTSSLDQIVISLVCYCYGFELCALNIWLTYEVTEQSRRLIKTKCDIFTAGLKYKIVKMNR
jgi:hypothetical protein